MLAGAGAGAAAAGAAGFLSACSSGIKGAGGSSSTKDITIGFITPLTGPSAGFASGDKFVLKHIRATSTYTKGFTVGGKTRKVTIVAADSQSDPNRASQVARQLILNSHVDMILTTSTPETTNRVAVVCQAQGVPCLSTVVPWESWYVGLGGNPVNPAKTFQYCTMFFFGLKEFQGCFVPMWNRVPNNKTVACMYPNDSDGNAFRVAFKPLIKASGYKPIDGGAYSDGTTDCCSPLTRRRSARLSTTLPPTPGGDRTCRASPRSRASLRSLSPRRTSGDGEPMWNLLAGYAGLVSVGQQAFIGLGAYFVLILAQHGLNPFLALPLAVVGCGIVGVPVWWLVSRLRTAYFAIATWVVASVCYLLIVRVQSLGGGTGMALPGLNDLSATLLVAYTHWVSLAVVVLVLASVYLLLRSRLGLVLVAIRDDEVAAHSCGVRVSQAQQLGAIVFFVLQQTLASHGTWYFMILGVVAMVVAIWARRGLWGCWPTALFPAGYWLWDQDEGRSRGRRRT